MNRRPYKTSVRANSKVSEGFVYRINTPVAVEFCFRGVSPGPLFDLDTRGS